MWYAGMQKCIMYEHDCVHTCIYVQGGQTALYTASRKGHEAVVELLLKAEHTDVSLSRKV